MFGEIRISILEYCTEGEVVERNVNNIRYY